MTKAVNHIKYTQPCWEKLPNKHKFFKKGFELAKQDFLEGCWMQK